VKGNKVSFSAKFSSRSLNFAGTLDGESVLYGFSPAILAKPVDWKNTCILNDRSMRQRAAQLGEKFELKMASLT
jgi:hypothetical protein